MWYEESKFFFGNYCDANILPNNDCESQWVKETGYIDAVFSCAPRPII
jgi:hypothetical protein